MRLGSYNVESFFAHPRATGMTGAIEEVAANGRGDRVGSVELETAAPRVTAIQNTARVINDVNADVLGVVEVESRPTLKTFAVTLLQDAGITYPHAIVIDREPHASRCRSAWFGPAALVHRARAKHRSVVSRVVSLNRCRPNNEPVRLTATPDSRWSHHD